MKYYLQVTPLEKTIPPKHYLQFLSIKRYLVLIRKKTHLVKKNYSNEKHFISIKTIHFDLKNNNNNINNTTQAKNGGRKE